MKKTIISTLVLIIAILFTINSANAVITTKDYEEVIKTTKEIQKKGYDNDFELIKKYYSDNYKSFDGYGKEELLSIYKTANEIYPDLKSKEKIKEVITKDDLIKVIVDEKSYSKILPNKGGVNYFGVHKNPFKGKIESKAKYAIIYKKENGIWKIVEDEIYEEESKVSYGKVTKEKFTFEIPDKIKVNEPFSAKAAYDPSSDFVVLGSIGHDEIIFPPKHTANPFRLFDNWGELERVMIPYDNGNNEYVSVNYMLVTELKEKPAPENNKLPVEILGFGWQIKRVNVDKTEESPFL